MSVWTLFYGFVAAVVRLFGPKTATGLAPAASASIGPHAGCDAVNGDNDVMVKILAGQGLEEWKPFGRWFLHIHACMIAGSCPAFTDDERDGILYYIEEYRRLNPQYHMLQVDENVRFVKDCKEAVHMKRLIAWFVRETVDERFGQCIIDRIDEWIQRARLAYMFDEAIKLEHFRDIERLLEH